MKLATLRDEAGEAFAARIEGDVAVRLPFRDVAEVLRTGGWRDQVAGQQGARSEFATARLAPLVLNPDKVICAGLNYRSHIVEMGRELPKYPALFTKFASTLTDARADIALPPESPAVDWEAELAIVIGTPVRRATSRQARSAIAGYTIMNDVSMRDWQHRTGQWLAGKVWEKTTPIGPVLVTPDDEDAPHDGCIIECLVDDEVAQKALISDLLFDAVDLVSYVSTFVTLVPGDVIATGTPGGVGDAAEPPRYLKPGQTLVTRIDGLGECRNVIATERTDSRP